MKIAPYSTFWNICNCLIFFPPCLLRTRSNRGRLVEVQSTHIFLKEYFSTSLLPAVFPFFIIFHHPDLFTPTASSSDLVFPLKIAAWMGRLPSSPTSSPSFPTSALKIAAWMGEGGSHYQLFSLTTPRVRQRCRETQYYTARHHMEHCFFGCCRSGKKIYFEEDNNHLVTTFAGVNFLDGITQCMDVRSCFSRFFVKLFPYFPTSAFTKIEIKVVGSTMKGGASPWLFSHSISSFEYKVASTVCQEFKKNTFSMRIRLPRGIPTCYKKLFY